MSETIRTCVPDRRPTGTDVRMKTAYERLKHKKSEAPIAQKEKRHDEHKIIETAVVLSLTNTLFMIIRRNRL